MTDIEQVQHDRDVALGELRGRVYALEERVGRREATDDERWQQLLKLVNEVRDSVTGWKAQERLLVLLFGGMAGAVVAWVARTVAGH